MKKKVEFAAYEPGVSTLTILAEYEMTGIVTGRVWD